MTSTFAPYPPNSPQAAARVLAMALVADGHHRAVEWRALQRQHAPQRLGLSMAALRAVVDTFCEDLLRAADGAWRGAHALAAPVSARLLGEVTDPELRERVLTLCEDVARADGHVVEGEQAMLDALVRAWRRRPLPKSSKGH
jgi:uncharacterized tellurite resistance protein B-like protein